MDVNIISLLKILMEWGVNSKNYDVVYFIYTHFNIGIPARLLYKLPQCNTFNSLSSFLSNNNTLSRKIKDEHVKKLIDVIKTSKYKHLKHWNNGYGYCKI